MLLQCGITCFSARRLALATLFLLPWRWPGADHTPLLPPQCDITYFSARKLGCARGGGICIRSEVGLRRKRGGFCLGWAGLLLTHCRCIELSTNTTEARD